MNAAGLPVMWRPAPAAGLSTTSSSRSGTGSAWWPAQRTGLYPVLPRSRGVRCLIFCGVPCPATGRHQAHARDRTTRSRHSRRGNHGSSGRGHGEGCPRRVSLLPPAAIAVALLTDSGTQAARTYRAADSMTGVSGQAQLHDTPAGTQIDLTASGLPENEGCVLIAVT